MAEHVYLNRPMLLEAPERAPDGAGGFVQKWAALGTLWAELRARSGRDISGEGGAMSRSSYRITVRAAPPGSEQRPEPGQRFRQGARIFNIQAVTERDRGARFLICHAEEEGAL